MQCIIRPKLYRMTLGSRMFLINMEFIAIKREQIRGYYLYTVVLTDFFILQKSQCGVTMILSTVLIPIVSKKSGVPSPLILTATVKCSKCFFIQN